MTKQLPVRATNLVFFLSALLLVACVQPSPNNHSLAISRTDTLPAEPILRIENGMHTAAISSIDIDAKHRFIVTTSYDKTARVWDFATGNLLTTLRIPSGYGQVGMLECGAISPDGKTIAVGGWTGSERGIKYIYIFDWVSGKIIRKLSGKENTSK